MRHRYVLIGLSAQDTWACATFQKEAESLRSQLTRRSDHTSLEELTTEQVQKWKESIQTKNKYLILVFLSHKRSEINLYYTTVSPF